MQYVPENTMPWQYFFLHSHEMIITVQAVTYSMHHIWMNLHFWYEHIRKQFSMVNQLGRYILCDCIIVFLSYLEFVSCFLSLLFLFCFTFYVLQLIWLWFSFLSYFSIASCFVVILHFILLINCVRYMEYSHNPVCCPPERPCTVTT